MDTAWVVFRGWNSKLNYSDLSVYLWHINKQDTRFALESNLRREGDLMRKNDICTSWVVYKMTIHGKAVGVSAVCEQGEWDAMEKAQPGYHILIQSGISNEAEAEKLARTNGDDAHAKTADRKVPRR